jgi:Ni,Fe-hydrogenase III component G
MKLSGVEGVFERLPSVLPMWRATIGLAQWVNAATAVKNSGGRLLSIWGSDHRSWDGNFVVSAAYAVQEGLIWLVLPLGERKTGYPGLSAVFPAAGRMQRALRLTFLCAKM